MRNLLAILLGFLLFSQPVSAQQEESEPENKQAIQLCEPGKSPCLKGLVLNGDVIQRDVALFLSVKLQEAYEKGADAVILVLNTPGGDTNASKLIYDMIKTSPIPVHCITTAMAASGGFWAMEACHERAMTEDAKLMTHEPMAMLYRPARAMDLLRISFELRVIARQMARDCAPRMGITPEAFLDKIREGDWWMNSEEAVKNRAIDVVVPDLESYIRKVKARYAKAN